ncbi:response regulator [Oculatella sp. FACHB-28]|uniref:response regulator n=1 Tax=Oculatella sp. FACHB-28 TaxID=2692845 RepID=UPI001689321D|nr:response regulator [Oculatella sp. FACHB-28]
MITTASSSEALQVLARSLPNVVVSDIGMAKIDGYALIGQIRSRPPVQGGTIPAIAMSTYAAEIDQKKALQFGYQKHLTKPLEPEQLVKVVIA